MNISKTTLEILKNFSQISSNILVREGSTLRTITAGKTIFATADVEEEFPQEFAIYDLNTFIALVSTADDADVEFGEKSAKISKGEGEFEYYYADVSVIDPVPPTKMPQLEYIFTCTIDEGEIGTIAKAASIVGASHLSFVAKKGVVTLIVGDPKTPASNSYKRVVGKSKEEFNCHLAIEHFKVLPSDYTVSLSKKAIHFANEERKLEYLVALDVNSKV